MNKFNTSKLDLKELETELFRQLQEEYSEIMKKLLIDMDTELMESRDKKCLRHVGKRNVQIDTIFGSVTFDRNYYLNRNTGEYVHLLDQQLNFNGASGASPFIEQLGIEMAIEGPSFRSAADKLEKITGYRVVSHEWIRQKLLDISQPTKSDIISNRVLFVEVDGLHVSRQRSHRKSKEEKIVAVHQGWSVNGERVSLTHKRHFHHETDELFWEAFEHFLYDTFNYDPMVHLLVINGDQASWIQDANDHFGENVYVIVDRYHIAKEIRNIFRGHPRKNAIQRAFRDYNVDQLIIELNSVMGTLPSPELEEAAEKLLNQIQKNPDGFKDYRKWLEAHGIDTTGMRRMGNAESTMRVVAKRMKGGYSWSDLGTRQMMRGLISKYDRLPIQLFNGFGESKETEDKQENKMSSKKQVRKAVRESIRNNVPYLMQSVGKPISQALRGLQGV